MKKFFLLIIATLVFLPSTLIAQNFDLQMLTGGGETAATPAIDPQQLLDLYSQNVTPNIQDRISLFLTPSVPRPEQLVSAKLESSLPLDRLQISWFVNGTLAKREIGAINHQFQVGDIGEQTRLRVTILKPNGETVERNFTFNPSEVDIVYEAQTFTHPLYQGKALFTRESTIKALAIPQVIGSNGVLVSPENLVYRWFVNGKVDSSKSGYGKQTFTYRSPLLGTGINLGVEISTVADGAVANHTISVGPVQPEAVIYEKNPVLGTLYNRTVSGNYFLNKPEIEFEIVPYFFNSMEVLNRNTIYNWTLNGSRISAPNQNTLVFRNEKNESGQATIGASIANGTMLQRASQNFRLIFEENLNDFSF